MGSCSADNSLCLAGLSWLRGRVSGTGADLGIEAVFERRLRVTEMALGIVWVCSSLCFWWVGVGLGEEEAADGRDRRDIVYRC
jgi:hypothetical protein